MTYWKFYYRTSPTHTHIRVFSVKDNRNGTYAKNGDLTMRNEEWRDFQTLLFVNSTVGTVTFIDELNWGAQ